MRALKNSVGACTLRAGGVKPISCVSLKQHEGKEGLLLFIALGLLLRLQICCMLPPPLPARRMCLSPPPHPLYVGAGEEASSIEPQALTCCSADPVTALLWLRTIAALLLPEGLAVLVSCFSLEATVKFLQTFF